MMPTQPEVDREMDELHDLLQARVNAEPVEHFLSTHADRLPALRMRIDQKISSLGSGAEENVLGDEEYLGLIADLVEYRIALFNVPIAHYPTDADYHAGEHPPIVIKLQGTKDTNQ